MYVLGAGASRDYGFPLARGLRDDVYRVCRDPTPTLCHITGISRETFQRFAERLAKSGYSSVDWYLEQNVDDMPVGRAAIAAALTAYEDPTKLFPGPDAHWYETVVNRWWCDEQQSLASGSHVTILTFNYDRSLEVYLSTVVGVRTGREAEATIVKVDGVDAVTIGGGPTIVHLHGQLRGSYSATWSPDRLDADGLLLLSSAHSGSPEFDQARAAIGACNALYFLGFGFHPKSVDRLGDFASLDFVRDAVISGTHVGFTAQEWAALQARLFPTGWQERLGHTSVNEFVRVNETPNC